MSRKALLAGVVVLALACVGAALLVLKPWEPEKAPEPGPASPVVRKVPEAAASAEETLKSIADGKADYSQRILAVRKLGTGLPPGVLAEAVRLVKDPAMHETVRNDLMSRLEVQERPVGNLGPLLVGMYKDQKQSWLWRNYCVQHMAAVWELEPQNRGQLVETLSGVMGGEKGAMCEAAMLSLERIGKSDAAVAERVRKYALERVAKREEDPEAAVTALQVAANAGDASVLPEARKLAVDAKAAARLRMSAVAAVGRLGDQSDVELLATLAAGRDGRVQKAAELNLAELKKRLAGTGGKPGPGVEGPRP